MPIEYVQWRCKKSKLIGSKFFQIVNITKPYFDIYAPTLSYKTTLVDFYEI